MEHGRKLDEYYERAEMPHWVIPYFAKLGLGGVTLEKKYGGLGLTHME
jgi:glutaryl-CoA dehydrogenase